MNEGFIEIILFFQWVRDWRFSCQIETKLLMFKTGIHHALFLLIEYQSHEEQVNIIWMYSYLWENLFLMFGEHSFLQFCIIWSNLKAIIGLVSDYIGNTVCFIWYETFCKWSGASKCTEQLEAHHVTRRLQISITVSNQQCFWAKLNCFIFHLS